MKSRSGTFVLRLAAMAVLLEPVAAQGQGTSQKVCYLTADPITMKPATVCNEVSYPSPPAPPPEAPAVTRTPSSNSFAVHTIRHGHISGGTRIFLPLSEPMTLLKRLHGEVLKYLILNSSKICGSSSIRSQRPERTVW